MTKIIVSMPTFAELSKELERHGRTLNDGKPLTIEKGDAVMPPVDFKSAGIRQNCVIAAATAWPKDRPTGTVEFIDFSDAIFNWVLKGEKPEAAPTWGKATPPTTK